jgi:thiamine-monophosphate kinase
MQLSQIGEFSLIKSIQKKCPSLSREILQSIGDDGAVVRVAKKNLIATTDMMLEGVHFDLRFTTFYQLGYKLLAVNISDIFAMGGKPEYFLTGIGIPGRFNSEDINELYSGIMKAAGKFNITVIGGDTCSSEKGLVLSGTLLGYAKKAVCRSGAKVGDGIFATDFLGGSAMGLRLLQKRRKRVRSFSPATPRLMLMKKHLMPDPKPLKNLSGVTSMIDISDGLLIDLSHICSGSKVGALLYRHRIPISEELKVTADKMGLNPEEFALSGGEDYSLLFTAPQKIRIPAFLIGEIINKGRYIIDDKGRKTAFKPEGYQHFS